MFETDPLDDFSEAFDALLGEGLVEVEPEAIRLTERGMFFADSVAGLLAWRRSQVLRLDGRTRALPLTEAAPEFMG